MSNKKAVFVFVFIFSSLIQREVNRKISLLLGDVIKELCDFLE